MKIFDLLLADQEFVKCIEMSEKNYSFNKSFYLPFFDLIAKCISKRSLIEWEDVKSQIEYIFAFANYLDLAITEQDQIVNKFYEGIGKENDSEMFVWLRRMTYALIKQISAEVEDVIILYYSTGDGLISANDGSNAYLFYSKGLDLSESEWGRAHILTVRGHKSIAWFNYQRGEFDDALMSSRRALVSCFKAFGENHLETAQALNDYASILYNVKDFEESLKYHQMALRIREDNLGGNHVDIAISYKNVGSAMCSDYNGGGLVYLIKALKMFEQNYSTGHFEILSTYRHIGECTSLLNENELAMEYYDKILSQRDESRTYDDNFYAEARTGLGNCCLALENYEEALEHYLSAFKSYKAKDELHPEKSEMLGMGMFVCYQKLGNNISDFLEWLNSSVG